MKVHQAVHGFRTRPMHCVRATRCQCVAHCLCAPWRNAGENRQRLDSRSDGHTRWEGYGWRVRGDDDKYVPRSVLCSKEGAPVHRLPRLDGLTGENRLQDVVGVPHRCRCSTVSFTFRWSTLLGQYVLTSYKNYAMFLILLYCLFQHLRMITGVTAVLLFYNYCLKVFVCVFKISSRHLRRGTARVPDSPARSSIHQRADWWGDRQRESRRRDCVREVLWQGTRADSALPRHPGRAARQRGWCAYRCRHRYVALTGMYNISPERLIWLKTYPVYNMWVYKIYIFV